MNFTRLKIFMNNFIEIFSKFRYILISLTITLLIGTIFFYNTLISETIELYGITYLILTIISQALISLLFGIFISATIYKYLKFSSFSVKENSTSFIGTIMGLLVAGCPACTLTMATYIGIGGTLMAFLPWYGLELKILAIPLLLYGTISSISNLNTCEVKLNR